MKSWYLSFTGSWPTGVVLPVALAAVVLAHLFYRKKKARLAPGMFLVLSLLRTLAIVIAALFLLKPVICFSRTELEDKEVLLLVDVSESMSIKDALGGRTRLAAAVSLLHEEPFRLWDKLAADQVVRLFSFGAYTRQEQPGSPLQPDQKATALGEGLREALTHVGVESVGAVVLISDGNSNAGEDPVTVARTCPLPVYTVSVGGKAEKGEFYDVGVSSTPHNLEFIVNNKATVNVRLRNFGLQSFAERDRELTLTLSKGGEELAATQILFPSRNATRNADIEFTPRELGIHKLVLSLPVIPGEMVTENNTRAFTVRVIDPRIRTLQVEGVARAEYRFLRRVLESDPNIELTSIIKLQKDKFLWQGIDPGVDLTRGLPTRKEDFEKFDVVVLGDIAREEFNIAQLEDLKDFVYGGGGLLAMGGYHAYGPGGYAGSPLAELLPVTMTGAQDGHAEGSFVPRLEPSGHRHPVLDGCAEFFAPGSGRAALEGANRVTGVKPGAEVLLVHPVERTGGAEPRPLPIVAVQRFGSGFVMALTADTTWKWKFQVEAKGLESPYYRFWRQSVRWLAGRKEDAMEGEDPLSAWPNKLEYPHAETVLIEAKVRDKAKQPKDDATVEVEMHYPTPIQKLSARGEPYTEDSTSFPLAPVPLGLGAYQASFRPPKSGVYRAVVTASDEGEQLGRVEFEFVVGQAVTEFDRVDVDELTLRAVAGETGGEFHTLVTAGQIPEQIEQKRRRITHRNELNLWNAPGFFLIFLGCVSLEWVLRKKFGLN